MAANKILIDLHVHTDVSPCGQQSIEECLQRAREIGLHVLCITDHFSTEILSELEDVSSPKPLVLVGMEYSTKEGDFLLFAPPKVPYFPRGLPAEEVFSEIHRLGGVVIWAHPFRWGRIPDERLLEKGLVDAIEVLNGRTSPLENEKARALAEAFGFPKVAGSDAHLADELGTVANVSSSEINSLEDLIETLKKGRLKPKILSKDLKRTYKTIRGYK